MSEFRITDVTIRLMTEQERLHLESQEWMKYPKLQSWLGTPQMTITSGAIDAKDILGESNREGNGCCTESDR